MSDSLEMGMEQERPPRLPAKAESVYRYIIRYKRLNEGESPTRRQIQAAVGISSTSMVHYYLSRLEQAGRILLSSRSSRSIGIPGARWVMEGEAAVSENRSGED